MNLLFCFTENWIWPAKVTLYSIAINTPEERFRVYVFYDEFSREKQEDFAQFAATQCRAEVVFIEVSPKLFAGFEMGQWPPISIYRLLAPILLPREVDRVLYLDVDILVLNSLRNFYNSAFDQYCCIAFQDRQFISAKRGIAFPGKQLYANSGTILMNLPKMREIACSSGGLKEYMDNIAYVFHKLHGDTAAPDQDVFNWIFGQYSNVKRDCMEYILVSNGTFQSKPFVEYMEQKAMIVHFLSKNKPWKNTDYNKYTRQLYKRYAAAVGWEISLKRDWKVVLNRGLRIYLKKCIGLFSGHMAMTPQEKMWRESIKNTRKTDRTAAR